MRRLDDQFMEDLKQGILFPILERVRADHTLMLAIRRNYINVYYRGGNLLKLEKKTGNIRRYKPYFNPKYFGKESHQLRDWVKHNSLPLATREAADAWVIKFGELKQEMDLHFGQKSKDEREFQQLIVRENNYSRLSNSTEYFFTDIEYTSPKGSSQNAEHLLNLNGKATSFRFDMLGVEWLSDSRDHTAARQCRPVIVEVKYGDASLAGSSGMKKHLRDMKAFLDSCHDELVATVNDQLSQLQDLGLIKIANDKMRLQASTGQRPIVIFVVANANPRADGLRNEVAELAGLMGDGDPGFDIFFFVANFAGYAMHADSLLDLASFNRLLKDRPLHKG